jgi:hypothetical protein
MFTMEPSMLPSRLPTPTAVITNQLRVELLTIRVGSLAIRVDSLAIITLLSG